MIVLRDVNKIHVDVDVDVELLRKIKQFDKFQHRNSIYRGVMGMRLPQAFHYTYQFFGGRGVEGVHVKLLYSNPKRRYPSCIAYASVGVWHFKIGSTA